MTVAATADVTIVTPTLNAARYFAETLSSIREQSQDIAVQHIVVDDGSMDETVALAEGSGATILRGRNRGLYDAMNLGLDQAEGAIVGVLNADDCLLPGALRAFIHAMETGRPWAVGGMRWVDAGGAVIGDLRPPPAWLPVGVLAAMPWSYIGHPATYMRREFWELLGGFDTSLPIAADFDLFMRARRMAPYARIMSATTTFRRHGENASRASERLTRDAEQIADRYAPGARPIRRIARLAGSAIANARNPAWAIAKRDHI